MKSSELGLSAMYRILKKSGAERVSDESADELRRVIEEIASSIAKNAVDMSIHAGRKTVWPAQSGRRRRRLVHSQHVSNVPGSLGQRLGV